MNPSRLFSVIRSSYCRLVMLSALIGLSACGADVINIKESAETKVDGASIFERFVGDMGFGDFINMDLSQNSELKNQGISKDQIDSVKLSDFTLTITAPESGQDFSFLESLIFSVEAADLPRAKVAEGGPFADGATSVTLNVQDLELAPYVSAAKMDITSEVTGRRPNNTTTIRADLGFRVNVSVLGF